MADPAVAGNGHPRATVNRRPFAPAKGYLAMGRGERPLSGVADDLAAGTAGIQPRDISLVAASALGYAIATIGMKLASSTVSIVALGIIALGLLAATVAEVSLLRRVDLGVIYITIIGVESLVVLGFAALIGEGLDLRRMAGSVLVIAGLVLVTGR